MRQSWFEIGSRALKRASGGRWTGYACPLCGRLFSDPDDDELTLDHAPPESVGGRHVALTCKSCNSEAGHSIDRQVKNHDELTDLYTGQSRRPIPIRFAPLGSEHVVRAQAQWRAGSPFEVIGLPRYNDPAVTSAHNLATEAMVEGSVENQGWNASHPSHAYCEGDVVAGWLKSAYLVAFAQFGYSWAFTPALVSVRAQIREPRKPHLERFWLYSPRAPRD